MTTTAQSGSGATPPTSGLVIRGLWRYGDSVQRQFFEYLLSLFERLGAQVTVKDRWTIMGIHPYVVQVMAVRSGKYRMLVRFTRHFRKWERGHHWRWFKKYGTPPRSQPIWKQHMHPDSWADRCDVMVVNAGLHYARKETNAIKPQRYVDAMGGLLSWALNWSSVYPHRAIIWRETTPQHFGEEGVWHEDRRTRPKDCTQLRDPTNRQQPNQQMDWLLRNMTMDYVPRGCRTPGAEWLASNPSSPDLPALQWTSPTAGGVRKVGALWRLPVWDLMVGHPEWHRKSEEDYGHTDCTHYCFTPTLWEALFERLALLLRVIEGTRPRWQACQRRVGERGKW
eukprot:Hpha_TRINITY_DN1781_c0_g1::TRINITY_DN1781_c0_g1_i1::g.158393::m.158393